MEAAPPARISLPLDVRGYELDRTGVVPATVLLRYMEHVRWEGLRKGGVLQDMFQGGRRIVVRQQRLRVAAPLGYPQRVQVGLWVERVGRTSVEIGHDVRTSDGALVADALLVAVQLGPAGRPAEVSDAVRAQAAHPGRPDPRPVVDGGPPAGAFVLPLVVRPHEIDLLQHVNHSFYAEYFDDARHVAAAAGAYGEPARGAATAREVAVDYARSALPGDRLRVATWVQDAAEGRVAFELTREGGEVLCTGAIAA